MWISLYTSFTVYVTCFLSMTCFYFHIIHSVVIMSPKLSGEGGGAQMLSFMRFLFISWVISFVIVSYMNPQFIIRDLNKEQGTIFVCVLLKEQTKKVLSKHLGNFCIYCWKFNLVNLCFYCWISCQFLCLLLNILSISVFIVEYLVNFCVYCWISCQFLCFVNFSLYIGEFLFNFCVYIVVEKDRTCVKLFKLCFIDIMNIITYCFVLTFDKHQTSGCLRRQCLQNMTCFTWVNLYYY